MSVANLSGAYDPFGGQLPVSCGRVRIVAHASFASTEALPAGSISAEENSLASRLRDPVLRSDRLAHYAARRIILADLTGRDVRDLVIGHTPEGAPRLLSRGAWSISLSRSKGWSCVGAGVNGRIGVDIEVAGPRHWRPMLGMLGDAQEAAEWEACLDRQGDPQAVFLRLWTAKEAVLKANQSGFQAGPRSVPIAPEQIVGIGRAFPVIAFGMDFEVWTIDTDGVVVSFARTEGTSA